MKSRILFLFFLFFLSILFINNLNAQRYWNVAANFNGTGYIAVGQFAPLRDLSGSFTVECWMNCSQPNGAVFGKAGIRLLTDNVGTNAYRMRLQTNGNTKFYSRYNSPLQKNKWYHVACTYDSTGTGSMKFYINGSLDTSRTGTDLGPNPVSSSDSLLIGKSSFGNYYGMLDDIRIWDRPLSQTEIAQNMRNPYVGSIGYNGPVNPNFGAALVLSAPFDFTYSGPGSQLYFSDGYNTYVNNGATHVSIGNNPSVTLSNNNSLYLSVAGDYARMTQHADINFIAPVTVEAWINPSNSTTPLGQYILTKGTDYFIGILDVGKLIFGFKGLPAVSRYIVPANQWTHVAITCTPAGLGSMFVNGKLDTTFNFGSIPAAGTDTLKIGMGANTNTQFLGYIDAVKISNYVKTEKQILDEMFEIIDNSNKPASPNTTVSLNFDYQNYSSTGNGGYYYFRNGAKYTSAGYTNDVPVSPMLGNNISNFPNGYILKYSGRRIPEFSTVGYMKIDSMYVNMNAAISDLKLFIALNHTNNNDLQIKLVSPSGDSLLVYDRQYGVTNSSDHIITVFDDGADSSLVSGKFVSFDPRIKPANPLNAFFSGKNSQGTWQLRILDNANGNSGVLYGWGLRINNSVGIKQISGNVPDKFSLSQNYPNPFNPVTNINYSLSKSGLVKITVFDILGKEIETLVNENLAPGTYSITFDAGKYSSGIYFYRMKTDGFTDVKKMILLK